MTSDPHRLRNEMLVVGGLVIAAVGVVASSLALSPDKVAALVAAAIGLFAVAAALGVWLRMDFVSMIPQRYRSVAVASSLAIAVVGLAVFVALLFLKPSELPGVPNSLNPTPSPTPSQSSSPSVTTLDSHAVRENAHWDYLNGKVSVFITSIGSNGGTYTVDQLTVIVSPGTRCVFRQVVAGQQYVVGTSDVRYSVTVQDVSLFDATVQVSLTALSLSACGS